MDRTAFQILGSRTTHQALGFLIPEWETTQSSYADFEQPIEPGCSSACELPVRWGLPCQHWIHPAISEAVPLPLSLVHPQWLLDRAHECLRALTLGLTLSRRNKWTPGGAYGGVAAPGTISPAN